MKKLWCPWIFGCVVLLSILNSHAQAAQIDPTPTPTPQATPAEVRPVCVSVPTFESNPALPPRQMEKLTRGLVRVAENDGNFLSWRLFGTDPVDIGFHVYRDGVRITETPLTDSTNYVDQNGKAESVYTVRAVLNGQEQPDSEPALNVSADNYFDIPIQAPAANYNANDASAGDLDGDGDYDIVLKWDPSNSQDNSKAGVTDPTYLDAYTLEGQQLWRINLGINIRSGAHYTQFMVYDLDGDGRAEIAAKTADGTVDGRGAVIGDANADYRNEKGYILDGPEFLTVFDGLTGAALATVPYVPPRGDVKDWGDDYGNRVDRFLAAIAYLDGARPSLIMARGYYTRTVLAAWDWRDGQLTQRWVFDSNNGYPTYVGQGNHQLSVADVDHDGRDEILYGAMAVDDDGTGLWNTTLGHGDALHVSDLIPERPGLEIFGIHERRDNQAGSALLDAKTGEVIWKTKPGDVGRGVAADITAASCGAECWGGADDLQSCATGEPVGSYPISQNHLIWWDGDELRELLDGVTVFKYKGPQLLVDRACMANNGTKANPTLTADLLGDWREELIWRLANNTALRVYTTSIPTTRRIYTLMHDPVYRLGVAWQNVAYNQPPHTGFFLGDGMLTPPQPKIYYAPSRP